jgi:hypothetical protein
MSVVARGATTRSSITPYAAFCPPVVAGGLASPGSSEQNTIYTDEHRYARMSVVARRPMAGLARRDYSVFYVSLIPAYGLFPVRVCPRQSDFVRVLVFLTSCGFYVSLTPACGLFPVRACLRQSDFVRVRLLSHKLRLLYLPDEPACRLLSGPCLSAPVRFCPWIRFSHKLRLRKRHSTRPSIHLNGLTPVL